MAFQTTVKCANIVSFCRRNLLSWSLSGDSLVSSVYMDSLHFNTLMAASVCRFRNLGEGCLFGGGVMRTGLEGLDIFSGMTPKRSLIWNQTVLGNGSVHFNQPERQLRLAKSLCAASWSTAPGAWVWIPVGIRFSVRRWLWQLHFIIRSKYD